MAAEPVTGKAVAREPLFCIGKPDGSAKEFGLADKGPACESAYSNAVPQPVVVTVGPGDAQCWPFIQPSSLDVWAGGKAHAYTIRFRAEAPVPRKLNLVLGLIAVWYPSDLEVIVNGTKAAALRLPEYQNVEGRIPLNGQSVALVVPLPAGAVTAGDNTIGIGLNHGSWIVYDYVQLTTASSAPPPSSPTLIAQTDSGTWNEPSPAPITVRVDAQRVIRTMAGGMGASWHAIRKDLPGQRGSAWGANPPLENAKAWEQVGRHAQWLGLDWVRVEFDQRMYEPERGRFDWDNDEMRTLYRILDWCETNHADVFLTQMFAHVEWNKLPGQDALKSAPKSVEDFAEGLATLVDHLLNKRRYTCIRWLCIVNEPGISLWWVGECPLSDGLKATRKALDAKGIALPLSGPDSVNGAMLNAEFDKFIGAYDTHTYQVIGEQRWKVLAQWSEWAHARKKPFFLSEFGIDPPWGDRPKSYPAVLLAAETVLYGLSVGVDGFNRWSFLNRGDLDGHWQLVRTWDIKNRRHLEQAEPELVPYMGYAMLTRFTAKHSGILDCRVTGSPKRQELAGALRSPAGNITILLLNLNKADCDATLALDGSAAPLKLHPYVVSEPALAKPDFALAPGAPLIFSPQSPQTALRLPPLSITTLTTFRLLPADPGIIEDAPRQP
jgi:hypothetical protein